MSQYIQFKAEGGSTVLVAVDEEEVTTNAGYDTGPGTRKAGLGDKVGESVVQAKTAFDAAIEGVVQESVEAFMHAIRNVRENLDAVEVVFGIKATGELGNFAIAKVSAEANFSVKMTWKFGKADEH
jgi:hypothetical protein